MMDGMGLFCLIPVVICGIRWFSHHGCRWDEPQSAKYDADFWIVIACSVLTIFLVIAI